MQNPGSRWEETGGLIFQLCAKGLYCLQYSGCKLLQSHRLSSNSAWDLSRHQSLWTVRFRNSIHRCHPSLKGAAGPEGLHWLLCIDSPPTRHDGSAWKRSTLFHVLESLWVSHGSKKTCWCSLDQFSPECQVCTFYVTEFRPGSFPLQHSCTYPFSPL